MKKNIDMKSSTERKPSSARKSLIFIFILAVLIVIGYFFYDRIITWFSTDNNTESNTATMENETEEKEEIKEEEPIVVDSLFTTIDGQEVYIATDLNPRDNILYPLVIYSHGSTYSVSSNPTNQLTKDLDFYADIFVNDGYIFAASNQHGDNWGNSLAIEDTRKLIEYIDENYKTNGEIYLLGFSMGGLVTMNYAEKYPEDIAKIALLAPTSYATTWNSGRVQNIFDIPIKIWHGNKDVNVPYSMTTNLIKRLQSFEKEVELVTVPNVGHFDIDTEYTLEVLDFFNDIQ